MTVLGSDMLTIEEEPVRVVPGCEYSEGTGFEGHAFLRLPLSAREETHTISFTHQKLCMNFAML